MAGKMPPQFMKKGAEKPKAGAKPTTKKVVADNDGDFLAFKKKKGK